MIAVILPSRGLIFSETAEEIINNLKGIPHKFFFAHELPIPDCFEVPVTKALKDPEITHLWIVEDDMVLAPDTLKQMLGKNKAVVTVDYPVNTEGMGAVFKVGGEVIYCGTGCLLIQRAVFDELKPPYFRTDMRWGIKNFGKYLKMNVSHDPSVGYGYQDVNFCMELYHQNIPIHLIPGTLSQRKLVALGKAGSNNGAHQIEVWKTVKKDYLLKELKKSPVLPSGNLVSVNTPTGEVTVSKTHAKKLIKEGLATAMPVRPIVVDWSLS